jgi:hypothetical protein
MSRGSRIHRFPNTLQQPMDELRDEIRVEISDEISDDEIRPRRGSN